MLTQKLIKQGFGTQDCVWHPEDSPNIMQARLKNMYVV